MSSDRKQVTLRIVVALLVAAIAGGPAVARVLLPVEEALGLAFDGDTIERESIFLTEDELTRASTAAGEPVTRALVVRYVAHREGIVTGTAYLDAHRVRTLEETLFVVVRPGGEIGRVEVLSFDEPPDYIPRAGWYGQFNGRALDDELRLDRAIRAVTGATLTAAATTAATRRVLAMHQAIESRVATR